MKKITFLFALLCITFISSTSFASNIKTSGAIGIYSRYFDHGYDLSGGKAFSTISGSATYDALSVSVLSKQSISGNSGYNGIEGALDCAINNNSSIGVRSYSLSDVTTEQDVDAHISATSGAFTVNAERRISGPNTSATYGELVITIKPIKAIDILITNGVGNKFYKAKQIDSKFELVNSQVLGKVNLSKECSVFASANYNSAQHKTFDTNDILYAVGMFVNI